MAMYEIARALGLTCFVRPNLSYENDYSDEDEGDEYEVFKVLMGNTFHEFVSVDHRMDTDFYNGGMAEGMTEYFPGYELDGRKVTWLNRSNSEFSEPALAHITV